MIFFLLLAETSILLSQVSGQPFDLTQLAQWGLLGFFVLAFLVGKVVPGYLYERKEKECESLREENKAMRAAFDEKVIPALVRSTDILGKFAEEQKRV